MLVDVVEVGAVEVATMGNSARRGPAVAVAVTSYRRAVAMSMVRPLTRFRCVLMGWAQLLTVRKRRTAVNRRW